MVEPELLVCRSRDPHPELRQRARIGRHDFKPRCRGIDDHKTIAPVGGIDRQCAQPRDLERRTKFVRKRGHVGDGDALDFTILTNSPHPREPAGCLEHQLRLGLYHRDDAGLEQHVRDTD